MKSKRDSLAIGLWLPLPLLADISNDSPVRRATPATDPGVAGAPTDGDDLPAGCVASPKGGVEYHKRGNVYYRAGFQGNNLVYVV